MVILKQFINFILSIIYFYCLFDFAVNSKNVVKASPSDSAMVTASGSVKASVAEEFEPSRDMNANNQIVKQESNTVIRKSKRGVVKRSTGSHELLERKVYTLKDFVKVTQIRKPVKKEDTGISE